MLTYELVLKPLILALIFFVLAILYFVWLRNTQEKTQHPTKGKFQASLLGWSLSLLGGFCLFISVFFLVAG